MKFHTIEEAVADIKKGKMVILIDDEDRENEGDLVIAAEKTTPEAINFMAKYGRGLVCLTLTGERTEQLQLAPMAQENTSSFGTAFTISIDARRGGTTGISVNDRAGETEGSVDLSKLAGLYPAGVICEIMNEDGSMARVPDLIEFGKTRHLKV